MTLISIFLLNSCSEIIVQQKCPKLQTYKFKVTKQINYKVKNGYALVPIKDLKLGIKDCSKHNKINNILNKEIEEYNSKFVDKNKDKTKRTEK